MSSIKYRSDIDGLRAIAIILVVLSHIKVPYFEGGFIGVDIFFVISGYLITSIIVSEIDNNTFSFRKFYIRRIRRILPALIFVLAVTSIAAVIILFPNKLTDYAEAQFASLTSWSNYYLWRYFGGYWRNYVQAFPLTHTWSLSVEEQFYFLWPTILFAAYKFIPKKFHKVIIFLGLAGLLVLSQSLVKYPEFAFYMIPARAFELFFGAVIALTFRQPVACRLGGIHFRSLLEWIGIGLILYSAVMYKANMPFPGTNAFWPCLGAALIVLPKTGEAGIFEKGLSSSPMVAVGKISYSLYLWHWPPIAFITYVGLSVTDYRAHIVVFSLLASYISYRFVEQRFRRSQSSFKRLFIVFVLIPSSLGLGFYLLTKYTHGLPQRYPDNLRKKVVAVSSSTLDLRPGVQLGKSSPTDKLTVNKYTTWGNSPSGVINSLLIGDSHATAIIPFVEEVTKGKGIKGVVCTRDSTPYLRNTEFFDRDINNELVARPDKYKMVEFWSELISKPEIKYVFIESFYYSRIFLGGDYPERLVYKGLNKSSDIVEDNKKSFKRGLEDSIRFIVDHNKIPVLFKDVPYIVDFVSLQNVKSEIFGVESRHNKIKAADVYGRHKFEDAVIDQLAEKYPSVVVIDPKKILCPDGFMGECLTELNGIPLYMDNNHLNYYGAKELARAWKTRFGDVISPLNKVENRHN